MHCIIVIPNRNRDISIVTRTLRSLAPQLSETVNTIIVDYGSTTAYQAELEMIVRPIDNMEVMCCPTQQQLWHKTRAINMVLKQCRSTYFMVLDMDCIVHPEFVQKAIDLASNGALINFPYGFLSEEESKKEKDFSSYNIDFVGQLTGTIIAETVGLKEIRGYDEFYHNWGAEDADIIARFEHNEGATIFYDKEVLLLHQWHPKVYRTKKSTAPYHSHLEQINQNYFHLVENVGRTANLDILDWGVICKQDDYNFLKTPDQVLTVENKKQEVKALIAFLPSLAPNNCIHLLITVHKPDRLKTSVKKLLKKKVVPLMDMETVNEQLLELIITTFRNCPYEYAFDGEVNIIELRLYIKK